MVNRELHLRWPTVVVQVALHPILSLFLNNFTTPIWNTTFSPNRLGNWVQTSLFGERQHFRTRMILRPSWCQGEASGREINPPLSCVFSGESNSPTPRISVFNVYSNQIGSLSLDSGWIRFPTESSMNWHHPVASSATSQSKILSWTTVTCSKSNLQVLKTDWEKIHLRATSLCRCPTAHCGCSLPCCCDHHEQAVRHATGWVKIVA